MKVTTNSPDSPHLTLPLQVLLHLSSLLVFTSAAPQLHRGVLAPTVGHPTPPHPITRGVVGGGAVLAGGIGHGGVRFGGVGLGGVGHIGIGHGGVGLGGVGHVGIGHGVVGHGVVGHGVVGHGVVGHGVEIYPDEISPYTYSYNVADDYSGSNFHAEETDDGTSNRQGSYTVALPDGRVQHVNYHANNLDGYVAEVVYDGTAVFPDVVPRHVGVVGGGAVIGRHVGVIG